MIIATLTYIINSPFLIAGLISWAITICIKENAKAKSPKTNIYFKN